MSSALVYTRVSTTDQVENYSLDMQERECRDYCEREGLVVDRVFREEGESAKTANRTRLRELLAYCASEAKAREITVVVVYRVDRLARAVEDHTAIRGLLARRGVTVRAVAESFDDSPSGRFIENVMAASAQFDNDLKSERTTDNMRAGLLLGRWMWRKPLGYRKPAEGEIPSMVVDPETAPLVRHAFEAIASRRLTKAAVVVELNDFGLRSTKGNRITSQSLGEMLRNPLYMGRVVNEKWEIDVEGDFEAIVEPELFEAVQGVLDGRAPTKASRVRDNPDFPLRRVVRCGRCASPLTGSWSTSRTRSRYPYYRCPKKGCCGSNIRKERLEDLLVDSLGEMSLQPEMLDLLAAGVEDAWQERVQTTKAAEKAVRSRLSDVERRLATLTDKWLDGRGVDDSTYEKQKERLTDDAAELRNRLSVAPSEANLARAIDLAQAMLVDLPRCWNRLEPQHRSHFVAALYPAGLTYEDGSIGTVENPWWMATSEVATRENEGLVPRTGFEPVLPG